MNILQANINNLDDIKDFYDDLLDQMNEIGYYIGWEKDIYPNLELIKKFIDEGAMFIGLDDGKIISAMAINSRASEVYDKVNWSIDASTKESLVIHILGVSLRLKGKGYGKQMINFAIDYGHKNNLRAIRMDVQVANVTAMKLYEKMGFVAVDRVNIVYDRLGSLEFIMYELPII